MRKQKRSSVWQEPLPGFSDELENEPQDPDEEIIDLEEIIEPHADAAQDYENDQAFDAEILDSEPSLDFRAFADKVESDDDFLLGDDLGDDLLREFPFFQDRKAEPEPTPAKDVASEKPEEPVLGLLWDNAGDIVEEAEASGEASSIEEAEPEMPVIPVPPPAPASPSLDDFVAQIEGRLVDTVREIVEARLPEIVRNVLREELEKLKDDLKPEA